MISFEQDKPAAQVGIVLKALGALGVAVDIVPTLPMSGLLDLDRLLGET